MGRQDYLNGDHSFKNWFSIMWKNTYIQLFIAFLVLQVFEVIYFQDVVDAVMNSFSDGAFAAILMIFGSSLPIVGMSVIGYKGFYQFWNDLKKGQSR